MTSRFPKHRGKKIRTLDRLVTQALRKREPVLPRAVLENHLRALFEKRTILKESALRFGTPQYFFDEPALAVQVARLRDTFSKAIPGCRTFYAMKSNSFHGICRHIVKAGMGLDVSSGWELSKALAMGCSEILFSGPGKTDEELVLACQHPGEVTLLMDSEGELERLSTITKRQEQGGRPLRVGIRVRTQGGGMWDKFGIPLKDLERLMRAAIRVEGIELRGIQFHTSWNLDPAPQVKMIDVIGAHVRDHVSKTLWSCLHFLDIGGGFWPEQGEWLNPENTLRGKILQLVDPNRPFRRKHYLSKAKPLHDFAAQIASAVFEQGPPLSLLEVWVEPGRWIANPAMHILLTVVDKKGARTVITDGGTNLLGWERPLTEFIPVINVTRPSLEERRMKIFGSLCTPHDLWGMTLFGTGIEPGDVLLIPDQGAYTYSLRQSFIKPKGRVVRYDGRGLEEMEKEESVSSPMPPGDSWAFSSVR